jgi:hypothetical protein
VIIPFVLPSAGSRGLNGGRPAFCGQCQAKLVFASTLSLFANVRASEREDPGQKAVVARLPMGPLDISWHNSESEVYFHGGELISSRDIYVGSRAPVLPFRARLLSEKTALFQMSLIDACLL